MYQLKCELRSRGRGTTGNKADLVASLRDALKEENIDFESWAECFPSKGNVKANEIVNSVRQVSVAHSRENYSNVVDLAENNEHSSTSEILSIQTSASAAEMAKLKRIEEKAIRAGLEAKLKIVLEKQELDKRISELARKKEILDVTEAIEISKARTVELGKHEEYDEDETNHGKQTPRSISNITNNMHTNYSNDMNTKYANYTSTKYAYDTNTKYANDTKTKYTNDTKGKGRAGQRSCSGAEYETSSDKAYEQEIDHINTEGSNIAGLLRREREITAGLMRLPPVQLPKFGGDVTEFPHFMKAFDMKIASKLSSNEERLFYLEQNMMPDSKPHSIVTACLYLENGYEEARNLLSRRYGSESALAAAFVDKFETLLQLKPDDIEGLDRFALELMKCKNAFGLNSVAMSDPRTLRSISKKLPVHSQHRWRHRADSINENDSRSVVFEDLVDFVVQEARVATNPVFGNNVSNTNVKQYVSESGGRFRSKPLVAATRIVSNGSFCTHCHGKGHEITDCSTFARLPYQDKMSVIMSSGLCYACLKPGHRSAYCRRRASCSTCASRHPTSLHIDRSGENAQTTDNDDTKVTACTTKSDTSESFKPVLPIVPVVLH